MLNAQGRIQGDCDAFARRIACCSKPIAARSPHSWRTLDRFIIMDDVELDGHLLHPHRARPRRPTRPATARCARRHPARLALADTLWLIQTRICGVPVAAYRRLPHQLAALRTLVRHRERPHALGCPARRWSRPLRHRSAAEALRVLEGTPRYGIDITRRAATSRRRPARPAPCTSPKAAISARRSSSASAPAAPCIAVSRSSRSHPNRRHCRSSSPPRAIAALPAASPAPLSTTARATVSGIVRGGRRRTPSRTRLLRRHCHPRHPSPACAHRDATLIGRFIHHARPAIRIHRHRSPQVHP